MALAYTSLALGLVSVDIWQTTDTTVKRSRDFDYLVKLIIAAVHVVDDLSVDEVGGDLVEARAVPRREQLLAVKKSPRGCRLGSS